MKKHDQLWDCGSSLYDSVELKSLQYQLDSAITGRTMSMPHLSHHRKPPPQVTTKTTSKKHFKSFHKLIKSLFRPKNSYHNTSSTFYVYDTSTTLSTIPELPETLPEFDVLSPEMKSLVTRTRSDRFVSTSSLGISCV